MWFDGALALLPFPEIDPVLVQIGPIAIRWYALAYIGGLLIGWWYMRRLNRTVQQLMDDSAIEDLLLWVTVGTVLGGRLGYVLFYNLPFYLDRPLAALAIWQGGMSFHGGLLGVLAASALFARRRGIGFLNITDLMAPVAPIGLFFGRIANFINGELYGRASDLPWAMVFPAGGPRPRHPSQLYEAALEGLVLFVVLVWLTRRHDALARPGLLTGAAMIGYGIARVLVETVREPDAQIGHLLAGTTLGQWLSLPLLAVGLWLAWRGARVARR